MSSISNRLKEYLSFRSESQAEFATKVNRSVGWVNNMGKTLKYEQIQLINKHYPELNISWLTTGKGEMIDKNPNLNNKIKETPEPKFEVEPQPLKGITKVHLVQNNKARAGWFDSYYSDEYLENLPLIEVPTKENHFGLYLAFKVTGDSMETEYYEDDIVVGREVSRSHWKNKLHINRWDFIIAHNTKGVLIKEITEHNVETGDITLHSLNDFYEDQIVNLRDVSRIFNVVDHRPDLQRRRLRRK